MSELFLLSIAGPIVTGIVLAIIGWAVKIPHTFNSLRLASDESVKALVSVNKSLKEINTELRLHDGRLSVLDRALSDLAETPFDSAHIAVDASRYPRFRKQIIDTEKLGFTD